jgi:hypothetical protein
MKKIILITFLMFSFMGFSQTKPQKEDTTKICFPVNVGKQILLDLNDLDRLKKQSDLDKKEIKQLENKVIKEEGVVKFLEQKDSTNQVIIKDTEEKVILLEDDNKNLRKDIKKIKTKNTIIEIVSGAIVGALTYIIVFK